MRKQYHFWPGEHGLDAWDVDRLIQLSGDCTVMEISLDSIEEMDTDCWFTDGPETPSVRRIVEQMVLIQDVDLSFPIQVPDRPSSEHDRLGHEPGEFRERSHR